MFYITTLMALLYSATAPFFRAINAENGFAILLYGTFQIVFVLACLFWFMVRRVRVLRMTEKGDLVHRTTFMEQGSLGFWRSVQALWTTIPAMLILMAAGICVTANPKLIAVFVNPVTVVLQVFAIREAVRSSLSLYYGVDKRDLEVFQSGYVHGGYGFRPWRGVKSIRPAEYDDSALMVVCVNHQTVDDYEIATMSTKKIKVRPHTRAEVYLVMRGFLDA